MLFVLVCWVDLLFLPAILRVELQQPHDTRLHFVSTSAAAMLRTARARRAECEGGEGRGKVGGTTANNDSNDNHDAHDGEMTVPSTTDWHDAADEDMPW